MMSQLAETVAALGPLSLLAICALGFFAGFVKGTVGFALPMILISGLGSFLDPDLALAGVVVAALVTNLWQALRNGPVQAVQSAAVHWRYLAILLICLVLSAQIVTSMSDAVLFLCLGIPVTFFALLQIAGWRMRLSEKNQGKAEIGIGAFAGTLGGISGIWGPPTVTYLTALELRKDEQMRVQGVIYGVGAIFLTLAHLRSGVLNADTIVFGLILLVPSLMGIAVGFAMQDRMSQDAFKRATLAVLVIGGLNLIRRGVF